MNTESKPRVAIGHVSLEVADVPDSSSFFSKLGLRSIVQKSEFAIWELRGGTHLVVRKSEQPPESGRLPFDLMVDDIEAAHRDYSDSDISVGPLSRGSIHDSFDVNTPDGRRLTVTSSHVGARPV